MSNSTIITPTITNFIKQRFIELWAIFLGLFAVFIAFAVINYDPGESSFHFAAHSNEEASNIFQYFGIFASWIADISIHFIGMAWIWLVVIPICWSVLLFKRHNISYFWLRPLALLWLVVTSGALLSLIDIYKNTDVENDAYNSGGAIGLLIRNYLLVDMGYMAYVAVFSVLTVGLFIISISLSQRDWKAVWHWNVKFFNKIINFAWKKIILKIAALLKIKNALPLNIFNNNNSKSSISAVKKNALKRKKMVLVMGENDPTTKTHQQKLERTKEKAEHRAQEKLSRIERLKSAKGRKVGNYVLPSVKILKAGNGDNHRQLTDEQQEEKAEDLIQVLSDFGVNGEIDTVKEGPVVSRYELIPAPGIKSSRVIGLADDIARSMSALSARIAVVPGRNVIGIELPNPVRETVYLRQLLESRSYKNSKSKLPMVLGKDISGEPVIADLAKMPHLLVAGTTGSGKSVGINAMIMSLLFKMTPDECRFIMIDPKMLELSVYDGIPHLLSPVVTDPKKAVTALRWVVQEMEQRYRLMSSMGVRSIDGYNKRIKDAIEDNEILTRVVQTGFDPDNGDPLMEEVPYDMKPMPFIVVIVDEMADLMLVAGKDIEASIQRLAQMARAAGIHLIMATQRPSVDVITGVVKANFPTRISFHVTTKIDSRTILGEQGAEQLLGMGDMLYMPSGGRIQRVHGPFVDDGEVEDIVSHLKEQGDPEYVEEVTQDDDISSFGSADNISGNKEDDLYNEAVEIIRRDQKISISYIQRKLKIGYNKAAVLVERMEEEGVVSAPNHSGKREIL